MRTGRRTLAGMDLDYPAQLRLAREVRDVIIDQGGIWPAVEAALGRRWSGDDLEDALMVAVGLMFAYRAPGGPEFFVRWREREPAEPEPARPRKRPWRRAS